MATVKKMKAAFKKKTDRLKLACWRRGLSVTEFARSIRRSRLQVYRAIKSPKQHTPTRQLIREKLYI